MARSLATEGAVHREALQSVTPAQLTHCSQSQCGSGTASRLLSTTPMFGSVINRTFVAAPYEHVVCLFCYYEAVAVVLCACFFILSVIVIDLLLM